MKEQQSDRKRWFGLAIVLLAVFMDLLDSSIVNVAIPSIQHNLHMTYAAIQWVTAGYVMAFALLLVTGGRMGDIFGRKRMFILGVGGFTLASLLSGIAPSTGALIAARLFQGAAAAIMVPQILATIQVTFSNEERGKVVALYSSITGLATVAGPLLGGLLIKANLFHWDWRTIFLVNVPVGIFAFIGAMVTLENSRSKEEMKLDLFGVAQITIAMLLLVYPLVQGRELGWPLWTYISMAASVPMFAVFVWYERYKNRISNSPLLLLSPFKKRSFWGGLIVICAFGAGVSSFLFIFSIWLQIGLGFSAIHTGLSIVPFTIGISLTAGIVGGKFGGSVGRTALRAGGALIIAGLLLLNIALYHYGIRITSWDMLLPMIVYGAGFGLVIVPLFNFILGELEPKEAGSASGLVSTMQQLGGAVGIAVVGVIFFSLIGTLATKSSAMYTPELQHAMQTAHIPAPARQSIVSEFQTCFHDRSTEKDSTVTPASCRQSGSLADPALVAALNTAGKKANEQNFTASFIRSIWVEVGIYVVMLVSISFLPRHVAKPKEPLLA